MGMPRKITDAFNKVFRRKASNDNGPNLDHLQFTVSPEEQKKALNPPTDNTVVEDYHGYKVSDPFRPLEDLDANETAEWVKKQNAKFSDYISDKAKDIQKTKDFLTDAWDYARESLASRYGDHWFSTFQEGLAAQPVYQVRDSADGKPRTLIDPNELSEDGTVALSGVFPSPDGKRVAYMISEAGSDAQTLRIRDVETGKDLPDVIENCRFTGVLWDKDSHESFQYTYPANDDKKRFTIKHHKIGDPVSNDTLVFELDEENSFVSPFRLRDSKYEFVSTGIGTDKNNGLFYKERGSKDDFKKLLNHKIAEISPIAEVDGKIYAVTTLDAPKGRLVAIDMDHPNPKFWDTLIAESDDLMEYGFIQQGKLFIGYSRDTADAIQIHDPHTGEHLDDVPLPVQSVSGFARINKDDTELTLKISSFLQPGDTYKYDIAKNELTLTRKSEAKYDLSGYKVERVRAKSKDGTLVPMTVIRDPKLKLDGTGAARLYGYGGFNVPLGPGFSTKIMHWVKSGGVYAQANLRGGGEFGTEWYDGGRLENKQNVFDDFIACAETLIDKGYTSNERLVIEGGSNGGLLTAATMLQRPDLFGAVIIDVPVTDMFRFDKATYGAAWRSDYGNPSIKKDFEVAAAYSPLHNVKKGVKLPPHVINTADHDDRVVPWHSFKLGATIQARGDKDNDSLLHVETRAGHGAGKPTEKIIQEMAETHAFIEKSIGPVDQNAYKATLGPVEKVRKAMHIRNPFK